VIYDPILGFVNTQLGSLPWLIFFVGIGVLLFSFSLLDRALPEMNAERSSFQRIGRLVYRPMAMFVLGMAVTSVTLSVSVSLSILVPLSAKGFIRRENMLPYIMGANITTFIDTLFAAFVMSGPAAFTIVLVEMVSVALVSLIVLLTCYRLYERAVIWVLNVIMRDNRTLGMFVAVMLITPLVLLFWPW
jgi:Na+/phosphate symporter